jgi:hypothetical protein
MDRNASFILKKEPETAKAVPGSSGGIKNIKI